MSRKLFAATAVLVGVSWSLGGCLIASSTSMHESGRRVSASTLSQIEADVTTDAWLLAALGEPTARMKIEGGEGEILRYDYQRRRESSGAVFLLFAGSSSETIESSTYFEVKDGIVVRFWSEK